MVAIDEERRARRGALWAGAALGLALAGFFDGILLHQVLGWHHLLSLVPGTPAETQVVADGLFHIAMYIVALVGLARLWTWRAALPALSGRRLVGAAALGFGAWHLLDVTLVHWVLGWHRTRLVDDALAWDLGWLGVFGFGAVALGLVLLKGRRGGRRGGGAAAVLGVAVVVSGLVAARPPAEPGVVVAVFPDAGVAFRAAQASDLRLVWIDRRGVVAALATTKPGDASRLYGNGALYVGRGAVAGCLGWTRIV